MAILKMSTISTLAAACVALLACTPRIVQEMPPAPVVYIPQQDEVIHTEIVHEHISDDKLVCPQDPAVPQLMTPKATGQYIAALTAVADQCRANLEALRSN
jgi:hypothetical protein